MTTFTIDETLNLTKNRFRTLKEFTYYINTLPAPVHQNPKNKKKSLLPFLGLAGSAKDRAFDMSDDRTHRILSR